MRPLYGGAVAESRRWGWLRKNQLSKELAREREVEAGTAVDSGFGPDFATVAVDDALDGCEADAGAGELGIGM